MSDRDLLYAEYPDVFEFTAEATAEQSDGQYAVHLEPNYCFPGGGGQPSDEGTINDLPFSNFTATNEILMQEKIEGEVKIVINQQARLLSSELHSGEHLLSAVFLDQFETGSSSFTIFDNYATIELDEKLTVEQVWEAERKINELIEQSIPIVSTIYYSREELPKDLRNKGEQNLPYRVVEIKGVDCCGCCGTHINNTGKLMVCKIYTVEEISRGLKLYFCFGLPAVDILNERFEIVDELTQVFSTSDSEIVHSVENLEESLKKESKKSEYLLRALADNLTPTLEWQDYDLFAILLEELQAKDVEMFASVIQKKHQNAIIAAELGKDINCVILSKGKSAPLVRGLIAEKFALQGGGNDERQEIQVEKCPIASFVALFSQ